MSSWESVIEFSGGGWPSAVDSCPARWYCRAIDTDPNFPQHARHVCVCEPYWGYTGEQCSTATFVTYVNAVAVLLGAIFYGLLSLKLLKTCSAFLCLGRHGPKGVGASLAFTTVHSVAGFLWQAGNAAFVMTVWFDAWVGKGQWDDVKPFVIALAGVSFSLAALSFPLLW